MRPTLAALLLAAAPLLLTACESEAAGVPGNGAGPQRSYAVADFDAVDATGPDDVAIRTGGGFSVRAEGDPKVLDALRIWREGNTLKVGRRNGYWTHESRSARIFVTMPRLDGATVTGSGGIVVDRVSGGAFKGATTGSGDLTVKSLAADAVSVSIRGSGGVALTGRARRLDVSVAGSGTLEAGALVASGASVQVMGSGDVRARVEGAASVALMGSGDVDLGPRAHCQVSRMGSGSVRCGG